MRFDKGGKAFFESTLFILFTGYTLYICCFIQKFVFYFHVSKKIIEYFKEFPRAAA